MHYAVGGAAMYAHRPRQGVVSRSAEVPLRAGGEVHPLAGGGVQHRGGEVHPVGDAAGLMGGAVLHQDAGWHGGGR